MGTNALAAVQREARAAPSLEQVQLEDPRDDEVLVRMVATGVCHTDMVMRDQLLPIPFPAVLGHEGAGVVERVGAGVTGLAVGDHVVLSFASCGGCEPCGAHEPAYCHSWFPLNFLGQRGDGTSGMTDASGATVHDHIFGQSSFASHALVNQRNVVKVPSDLPLEMLGPLGCGFQTGAGAILNSLKVRSGASVAVIGVGAVGLSSVMAAKIAGAATIVAIDPNKKRLELALDLGATHAYEPFDGGAMPVATASGLPLGFDYIVDTTGKDTVANDAVMALAPRGELAIVGAFPPGAALTADATHILSGGRVIRGVVEGGADPQAFIPQLVEYWRAGQFPFDRLVEFFAFEDLVSAIEAGESGAVVKPIVRFDGQ